MPKFTGILANGILPIFINGFKQYRMKYALMILALLANTAFVSLCAAWDGFDAGTSDLVEIVPDKMPVPGSTVDVRNYETGNTRTCLVESVVRNRRTTEVMVIDPHGERHILVMERR